MATAVIDLEGTFNFLTHKNNTDVFLQLGTDVCIQRASNIEVFWELDPDERLYLEEKYKYNIFTELENEKDDCRFFNPYDFWVRFGYKDFLGPFPTREKAVAAEEQELIRRAYA